MEPAVRCDELWKTFRIPIDRALTFKQRVLAPRHHRATRELNALRDVSFEVRAGEFFGVIGANGSGKSTLLMCLAGIYLPDRGRVAVAGRISPFIELGVGFNGELPALDNVVVNGALLGLSPAEARRRFPAIVEFAELEDFVDLKLKNYSSGMLVRLGFSAAIQAEADVYLCDEVLAVGDVRFQQKCFDTFRRFKREGRTVVFVSHDLASVERFCDRALLLEHGEAVALGEPSDVVQEYRGHAFLEAPPETDSTGSPIRWGDRSAEIVEASLHDDAGNDVTVVEQGDWVTLRVLVQFHRRHENPIFGAIVKTEQAHHAFVTNTMFDACRTGTFEPTDHGVYSVRFQALLAEGPYTVSPAVAYEDANRFADWREDFLSLRVNGRLTSGGIVDLPHESTVESVVHETTVA